ncbi:PAS domain-containing protein [Verrucomicrobiota bacterium]
MHGKQNPSDSGRRKADEAEATDQELRAFNQQLRASEQQLKAANQQLRAAEQAVTEERNKLQAIADAMEYGLTVQDRDYNVIYQNKVLQEMFGGLGDKCHKAYEGNDKRCDGCPVEQSFADGKSHTSERKVTLPTGSIAYFENTSNPIRNAAGEIVSCLEIARNVTDRRQAEEAMKAANQQLRASEQQLKASDQQLRAQEQTLRASQEELRRKVSELERFNRLMVGREMQMVEQKTEVNSLLDELGRPAKYNVLDKRGETD